MASTLLWINKDASSARLSRSTGRSETKIRRHVQTANLLRAERTITNRASQRLAGSEQDVDRAEREYDVPDVSVDHSCCDISTEDQQHLIQRRRRRRNRHLQQLRMIVPPTPISPSDDRLTSVEQRAFHIFCTYTARTWSGWRDEKFWSYSIPQLCQVYPAIAHALISIASLHEAHFKGLAQDRKRQLRLFSLNQRDKAIMVAIAEKSKSCQASLVACLALLCLQNAHHGHHSLRLLLCGRRILQLCERDAASGDSPGSIIKQVRPLLDRLHCRLCMVCEPLEALKISIERQAVTGLFLVPSEVPFVPLYFETLSEARDSLEKIFTWLHNQHASNTGSQDTLCHRMCEAWTLAVDNMMCPTGTDEQTLFLTRRSMLKAACLFGGLLFNTLSYSSEMIFDNHITTFQHIMSLIEDSRGFARQGRTEPQISFGIDDGLVDILAFVGNKCRHPTLRRQAVDMLLHSGRIEGGRLSCTAGIIQQALIEREEEGLSSVACPADIAQHRRRRLVKGEQFFAQRQICLTFAGITRDGEVVEEQCWVDLPKEVNALDPEPHNSCFPDTIFGRGYASFLDNREKGIYHVFESEQFFFPIPKA